MITLKLEQTDVRKEIIAHIGRNCSVIGYELRGKAEYFTSGKWLESIKKIPENKGAPCKGSILITINKVKVLS